MEELKNLNNFNGMMEVLSGLNSAAVRRMKKTFGGIGSDYSKKLQSMEDLLSHQFSFRAYRFDFFSFFFFLYCSCLFLVSFACSFCLFFFFFCLFFFSYANFEQQGAFAYNFTSLCPLYGCLFDRFNFYS